MFYRCQRFNSKPIQRLKKGVQEERSKGNRSAPWSGAPDCPVCHWTVSGAPGKNDFKLFTFGFPRRTSAIIHRSVWCATGLSGAPAEQRSSARNGRLCKANSANQMSEQRSEGHRTVRCRTGLSGVAPDCPVPHEDKASNGRPTPSPNGRMTWWHTGHCPVAHRTLSGGAPDCPVRPSPAAFSNGYNLDGGYKYHPNQPLQRGEPKQHSKSSS
jgi:hypothetical protein